MDLVSPSRLHADSGATHSAPRLHGEHTQQPPQLGGPQALGSYTLSSWCSLVLFWPSALPLGSPPFVTTQFLLHWDKSSREGVSHPGSPSHPLNSYFKAVRPGWWECKMVLSLGKTAWRFLKKTKLELLCDPSGPPVRIPSKELKAGTQTLNDSNAHAVLLLHHYCEYHYSQEPQNKHTLSNS